MQKCIPPQQYPIITTLMEAENVENSQEEEKNDNCGEVVALKAGIGKIRWLVRALEVDLSCSYIDTEELQRIVEALKVNRCLQKLNLSWNYIGAEGAKWLGEALKVNQCLQQLELSGSRIGDEGAKWISEALKFNQCLQQLTLSLSGITDKGARWIGEALKVNQCLQQLDLVYTLITTEGAKCIIRGAKSNLGLVDISWNFKLSAFEEDLTPFERSLPNMAALLAHWRQQRLCCRYTLLLGTEPPTLKVVNASPLWWSLARDALYDAQVWREIFELAGFLRSWVGGSTTK